jgi:hypothetical protein
MEQARIDRQLEAEHISNVGVVQPASYEPRPIRPRRMVNLLLGLGAGLFGGLALPLVVEQFGGRPAPPPAGGQNGPQPATPAVATARKPKQLVGVGKS